MTHTNSDDPLTAADLGSNSDSHIKPDAEFKIVPLKIPSVETPLQLCVHGEQDKFVSRRIREEGIWEPYETALLIRALKRGGVLVDVGANIGYFCVLGASIVGPEGAVFAFEPDPNNCALLRQSAALNGLSSIIEVAEAGLAQQASGGHLYLSENNLGDHQTYAAGDSRDSVPIQLLCGSEHLSTRTSCVDLLKIDTQGSEFQVVSGLMPFLQALDVKPRIIIELTPFSLREAGDSGRALIELLAQLQQPFWIIDHIAHRLVRSSAEDLALWCDNVDSVAGDEGFMNILLGSEL